MSHQLADIDLIQDWGGKPWRRGKPWNRCDDCGRFIAYEDFDRGAIREFVTPDTAFSVESYLTLCIGCTAKEAKPR